MKNISENTKVTLTVGQLRKLVSETRERVNEWAPGPDPFAASDVKEYIPWLRKSLEELAKKDSRYQEMIDSFDEHPMLWKDLARKALKANVFSVPDLKRWIEYRRR